MAIGIFGDTTEFPYNFSTKVAGNMLDCPMICYWVRSKELLSPTDTKWMELNQYNYDKLKKLDNNSALFEATTVGDKAQCLIELDLNGLCNNLYGGSNTTMKNNIKNEIIRAYGESTNGWEMHVWNNETNKWHIWTEGTSTLSNITHAQYLYSSTNKVYILLTSKNSASSTISSSLSLDFIEIKIIIARQPDIIQPMDINLNENWSILIKGFYPSWVTTNNQIKNLFYVLKDVNTARIDMRFTEQNQLILAYRNGTTKTKIVTLLTKIHLKAFQPYDILIQYKDGKFIAFVLLGNTITRQEKIDNPLLTGLYKLYLGQGIGGLEQADAFIEDIQISNQTFTNQEAEILLKGKNPNIIPLFNDVRWIKHGNSTISPDGKTLTLNATANWQESRVDLAIFPNNKYIFKATTDKNKVNGGVRCHIAQYYNTTVIKTVDAIIKTDIQEVVFTTLSNCNNIKIFCTNDNDGAGTFTFSNLELRRLN